MGCRGHVLLESLLWTQARGLWGQMLACGTVQCQKRGHSALLSRSWAWHMMHARFDLAEPHILLLAVRTMQQQEIEREKRESVCV